MFSGLRARPATAIVASFFLAARGVRDGCDARDEMTLGWKFLASAGDIGGLGWNKAGADWSCMALGRRRHRVRRQSACCSETPTTNFIHCSCIISDTDCLIYILQISTRCTAKVSLVFNVFVYSSVHRIISEDVLR